MKKFYTYVLVSLIIFASLSISPAIVQADDGIGPKIVDVSFDRTKLTRGQKVELVVNAEDTNGLASSAEIELLMPDGNLKILNASFYGDNRYRITLDLSHYWEFPNFGTYQIKNVKVMDRYGNTTVEDLSKETVEFEFIDDQEAPVVKNVKFSKTEVYSSWSDYVRFEVSVEDEGKPSNYATLYLVHSKTGTEKPVQLYYEEYDRTYRAYEWSWYDAIFGEWKVQRIEVRDVAGNSSNVFGPFEGDNKLSYINIEDDRQSPEFVSAQFVTLNPNSMTNDAYQVVAKDNAFVSEISATFKHRHTGKVVTLRQDSAEFPAGTMESGVATTANLQFDIANTFSNLHGFWDVIQIDVTDLNQNKVSVKEVNDSIYIDRQITDLDVRIVKESTNWTGHYIDQDVFIMPGALLTTLPNVTMTKNVYVLGALRTYGGLSVYGTLYGNRMTFGHSTPIYNGDIQVAGSNSLWNMQMSNVTRFKLPLNTGGALVENGDGTFDIVGITLPLGNKININGVEADLDLTGRFKAHGVPMNGEATAIVQVTASNGITYSTSAKVYDNQQPVVTASKDSGIYLTGTSLELTSTKEGTVYYNPNHGAGYDSEFLRFDSGFTLNNDIKIKYYGVDPTGIQSDTQEKQYRVFSVYEPKASESFIQGSGSPGLKIQAEVDEKIYATTINSEGRFLIEGLDLTKSKQVQIFATDEEYTSEAYTFDIIDDLPIVIEGVENQKVYNRDVTITYNKGDLYLNGMYYVNSGTTFTEDGYYELYAYNNGEYYTNISFTIDKTAPQVSGIQTGKAYKQSTYPTFTEGTATLNGVKYTSGTKIDQEGEYVLVVTDQVDNKTTLYFTIDYKAPIVSGVENGKIYNQHVTPSFNEGSAKLNGNTFVSGTTVKAEGSHELIVQDLAGNTTMYKFEIDLTAPKVTNVSDGATYRRALINFNEGIAKLNGTEIQTGHEVIKDGKYDLVVTDTAGNTTKLSFEVDSIAPIVSGVENGKRYNRSITPTFTEGIGKLNGKPFTNGTVVQLEGTYNLIVEDKAGNITTIQFSIDVTAPIVTGVTTNCSYSLPVVISFNEGTATLNGKSIAKNYTVNKDGSYELIVKDSAGNETIIIFEVDQLAPVVTGVEPKAYRENVTPVFGEGTATLNGKAFVSGTTITVEGNYELKVTDRAKNETVIRFSIDKKPVLVTGVENGKVYQQVKPTFTEGTAKLNGVAYTSGTLITLEGSHVLLVTDEAGNETKISFTIDYTAPVINGFLEERSVYREVTPTFIEGAATLNGQPFTSGTTISSDGDYELKVKDKAGNETTVRFKIDRKPVTVTGVESGKTYQQVKPIFTEGVGKLNGASYVSGTTIDQTGDYVLIVTDDAGNETKLSFSIDRTSPVILGFVEGKQSYREVTPSFSEGTALMNGKTFASGTKLVQEGKYVLKVTDQIGNVTTREFTIDRTTPIVTGVKSKQLTNKSVIVSFNEGSATLNGKNIASGQTVVASGSYTLKVTDEAGNVTLLTFTIDKVAPSKPTISTLTNKSTKVTGKAEKGSTVSIIYNGRTYTTKASTAGTYSYSLKTTKAGATVTVRAKDAAGNLSTTASFKVLNTFTTFTVNTVKSSATLLTGKGNKAATVQAFAGTKAISKTAKVDSKGNYKLTIPRQKAGVTVTVKMTQTGYQELKKATKVVK